MRYDFNFQPRPIENLEISEVTKVCDHLFLFMRDGNLHVSRIKVDVETDELIPFQFIELSKEEWDTVIQELDEDLFIKVRTKSYCI